MSQDINIYDTTHELARDLSRTSQFKQLKAAMDEVKADSTAHDIFKEFQTLQEQMSRQQVQGQPLEDDLIQKMQDLSSQMTDNDKLSRLIEVEQQMNALISDINRIVVEPISKLYQ